MNLSQLLTPDAVSVDLQAEDKSAVIEELIDLLDKVQNLKDRNTVSSAVFTREELISTGVGNGVALPHAKVDGIPEMMISLGLKKEGLDFAALDDLPVKIFFMVIAPKNQESTEQHLKVMARISRILKSSVFCEKILTCTTADEVIALIAQEEGLFI